MTTQKRKIGERKIMTMGIPIAWAAGLDRLRTERAVAGQFVSRADLVREAIESAYFKGDDKCTTTNG